MAKKQNKIIVTGFSQSGYEEYGRQMLQSYQDNGVQYPLIVYTNGVEQININNVEQRDQMSVPGLKEFVESCDPEGVAAGRSPVEGWTDKEREEGYSPWFDARRWAYMVFTIWDGARRLDEGLMMWMDGDSVFRRPLPGDFFERFLPNEADYSYLGREWEGFFTELGGGAFFRLPNALPFLEKFKDFYVSGDVYDYPEWHSAYMFDRARELFPEVKGHNLTSDFHPRYGGHVLHQCELGRYTDHLKGGRKDVGQSPETKLWWRIKFYLKKTKLFSFIFSLKNKLSDL